MATEKRTSKRGTVFDVASVRSFMLTALEHDAVADQVSALVFDHLLKIEEYSVDAEDFKRLITEVLSATMYIDWEWVEGKLLTGIDREHAITAARDDTAGTDQISDATIRLPEIQEMIEVEIDLPNLFVRPLASEEAHTLGFIQTGQQADDLAARTQAAILLGSNAGCTTSQIAAMLVVDEAKVRQVIADFNERGIAEIAGARRAERECVIETARKLDPQTFDIDTRLGQPGKYEGASDLQLVVALDIINGHGFADESAGEAAISGYAWRVNRFVGIEDSQGFIRAEDWPTARQAIERLRDFDVPPEDVES